MRATATTARAERRVNRYSANERSQWLKYHVQTSGRSLHALEIAFNDIRTTLQALIAAYDNCNVFEVRWTPRVAARSDRSPTRCSKSAGSTAAACEARFMSRFPWVRIIAHWGI